LALARNIGTVDNCSTGDKQSKGSKKKFLGDLKKSVLGV